MSQNLASTVPSQVRAVSGRPAAASTPMEVWQGLSAAVVSLIADDWQTEQPDPWMEEGYPFVIRREEATRLVRYNDLTVKAVPHDMPITGYGTKNVGTLRLWKAEPVEEFDYDAFNSQRFTDAIVERERISDISRVLYPNDTTYEGKVLRVRQQYFFCSASLQEIVDNYVQVHGTDLRGFADFNAVQLNDTHPHCRARAHLRHLPRPLPQ